MAVPKNVLIVATIACAVAAAYFLAWKLLFVLGLAFTAVLVATLLRTGGWALRRLIPSLGEDAALATFMGVLLVVVGAFALLAWGPVQGEVTQFAERFEQSADAALESLNDTPFGRYIANDLRSLLGVSPDIGPTQVGPGIDLAAIAGRLLGVVYGLVGGVAAAAIVVVAGIYLAFDPKLYVRGIVCLFPADQHDGLRRLADELGLTLRWWLVGKLTSMAVVAILSYLALLLLGVELAAILAVITFLFVFIPNFGPILSVIPPALIAMTQQDGGGMTLAAWVLGAYLVIQVLESYLITPLVQKRAVDMPPALLIFAQMLMGTLLGTLGVALAAPLAAVGLVGVRELLCKRSAGE
ncbi:MAG: AI-2E family transporter [Planctomycetota bacterium]